MEHTGVAILNREPEVIRVMNYNKTLVFTSAKYITCVISLNLHNSLMKKLIFR